MKILIVFIKTFVKSIFSKICKPFIESDGKFNFSRVLIGINLPLFLFSTKTIIKIVYINWLAKAHLKFDIICKYAASNECKLLIKFIFENFSSESCLFLNESILNAQLHELELLIKIRNQVIFLCLKIKLIYFEEQQHLIRLLL